MIFIMFILIIITGITLFMAGLAFGQAGRYMMDEDFEKKNKATKKQD